MWAQGLGEPVGRRRDSAALRFRGPDAHGALVRRAAVSRKLLSDWLSIGVVSHFSTAQLRIPVAGSELA
jgi:hypothetical protein